MIFELIAVLCIGMGIGTVLTASSWKRAGWEKKPKGELPPAGYRANWKPNVRTVWNTGMVKVYVQKITIDGKVGRLLIGEVGLRAENYKEEYARLIDAAQERAEFLTLEQNTYNYD